MLRNTTERFGSVSKVLHWLVCILLTAQFILIWCRNSLAHGSPERTHYMQLHRAVGVTIFLVGLVFIFWRMLNQQPLPPASQPRWQRLVAKIVHRSLLILLVLMPMVGYVLSCAEGKAVNFFGVFTLPCLIPEHKNLFTLFAGIHEELGILILILVGIHVLAALTHHFILKDDVLKRMLQDAK